jgi:hypothetical protein
VGDEGLEPPSASPNSPQNQAFLEIGGAKSGAVDPELMEVLTALARLSPSIKAAILAVLRSDPAPAVKRFEPGERGIAE